MMIKTLDTKFFTKMAGLAMTGSVIGNVLLAAIGRSLSAPPDTFGPYMYSSVIGLTALGVLCAAIVYVFFRYKFPDATKANKYFVILSIIGILISFYPDLALPYSPDPDDIGWTWGIIANLMLMHLVAGFFVITYFTRSPKTTDKKI